MTGVSAAGTSQPPPPTSGSPTTSNKGKSFANGDFETFLRMLTTQIKNQDPLNPMEGSEFAVQLATFSGVEQQVRTNELLQTMAGAGSGPGGLAQYADWIGKEARTTAPVAFRDQPITLDIQPYPAADEVVLVSRDSFGRVASSEAIGPGAGAVDWFGRDKTGAKLADGRYKFEIESWKDGKKLSTTPVATYARVTAAEVGGGGVMLVLANGSTVAASEVTALRQGT